METEAHEAFIFSCQASVSDQGVEEEAGYLGSVPPSLPSHDPSFCGKSVCLPPSLSALLSPIPSHDPTSQEHLICPPNSSDPEGHVPTPENLVSI